MSPADSAGTNTLGRATSPYLRQHADNPVHWQQWTPQALAEAAARDLPILLSVGYAACHWCHVMAHESFEDDEVAGVMNAGFVCIKVDREERPDIDAVYMNATVALTGQGGWPMTCFLTPDGRPFFCGTYYPKAHFLQLLSAVSTTWRDRRGEVEEASNRIAGELREMAGALGGTPGGGPDVAPALCDHAVAVVLRDQDTVHGGFGRAPKFPPSALLEALLRHYERTGSPAALEAVTRTGNAMARGGIYDQLAGGFARYSVDNAWVVPHFEKMLYDNALLLRAYAHWARRTGDPLARRVAAQTAGFLLGELAEGGMFISSLDADADGREGSTYVWTPGQLTEVLGADDGGWAAEVFAVTQSGTFEHGASVLQLPADPDDPQRAERVQTALLAARRARAQPGRDDKVVTSWNGLAITALTEAGVALGQPELVQAARRCAESLLHLHVVDGRLRRASLGGVVGDSAAILEDHAMLATGLLALHQLTAETAWLTAATGLLDTALLHFADPERPGRWFDTADDAERLVLRPADPLDAATPSGASSITEALLTAAHLVDGDRTERYLRAATDALAAHSMLLEGAPRSAGHWLAVAEAAVRGPLHKVTHFVAGIGTGGTITGAGRYLKEVSNGAVRVIGADPEGSVYSGGTGRPYLVEGVGEDFWPDAYDRTVPDEIIAVSDSDSFDMTRRLAREEAMLVGGSCGMAVVAAVKVAEEAGPDALIVVLLPDGGRGYMSKIFNDAWMSSYGFLRSRLDGSTEQARVGDVLRRKSGALPDLVHTHPSETVRDAIGILREYGVSQMPVVGAEPPVMAGEVAGSVSERELLSAVFEGRAKLADAVGEHMSPPLPMIGAGELIGAAGKALRDWDALMVVEEGKPVGVITRYDLLGFLSDGPRRR